MPLNVIAMRDSARDAKFSNRVMARLTQHRGFVEKACEGEWVAQIPIKNRIQRIKIFPATFKTTVEEILSGASFGTATTMPSGDFVVASFVSPASSMADFTSFFS